MPSHVSPAQTGADHADAGPRLLGPAFYAVTGATFAYFVAVGATLPTVPLYVEGPLGGGRFAVGVAVGAWAVTALVLRPWGGRLGDRRGRRAVIVPGAIIATISYAGYIVAGNLPLLIALRLVGGVGEALFMVGTASAITDLAPPARRGEAISLFSIALYGGITVGPFIGESVLARASFDVVWMVVTAVSALAIVIGLRVPETRPPRAGDEPEAPMIHRAGIVPGLVLLMSVLGFAGFAAFIPLYSRELGLGGSQLVFGAYSVVLLLIRGFGRRIPDRFGFQRTARIALLTTAAGMATIALWRSVPGLYAGTVVFGVGQALAYPAMLSLTVARVPDAERGAVVGTFMAFLDLAFGLGGPTLGFVADAVGFDGSFLVAAGVAMIGFVVLVTWRPHGRATSAAR